MRTLQTKSLDDTKERLLFIMVHYGSLWFIMAIETARCLEEGVIRSTGDGNIGSVFGIGYPYWQMAHYSLLTNMVLNNLSFTLNS